MGVSFYQDKWRPKVNFVNNGEVMYEESTIDGWFFGLSHAILPGVAQDVAKKVQVLGCTKFYKLMTENSRILEELSSLFYSFTIFAPSDEAMDNMNERLKRKMRDPEYTIKVVKYHTVQGRRTYEKFNEVHEQVPTLLKHEYLEIALPLHTTFLKSLFVQGASISNHDNLATNGIVHVVDKVFLPPS